ncbi:MAG: helix-turn-helix domain-containing protein [Phyllobacterium sp.]
MAIFQTRMAAVLNEMRKNRHFKLKDLARRVGVSNTYMTKIMRGQANISLSLLFSFCRELDVTVQDLIGNTADNSVDMPEGAFDSRNPPANARESAS